jgi:Fe-S-cluster-containing dehydrogenase component
MRLKELEKLKNEGVNNIPSAERRRFLKLGFFITGVFLGGKILSLSPVTKAYASEVLPPKGKYAYSPHYTMVIREQRCIDCERCKEACVAANGVPEYGYRTEILERRRPIMDGKEETIFMPVLCNHCNRPPCVRVCPTTATWKDEKTGIVMMNPGRCIGCKTCMTACPYNARYFKEEERYVDKCNFCYDTFLSKGKTETACVTACPADVRVFGDLADESSRVFELLHTPDTMVWVLRPESGALPNVYYTNA